MTTLKYDASRLKPLLHSVALARNAASIGQAVSACQCTARPVSLWSPTTLLDALTQVMEYHREEVRKILCDRWASISHEASTE
jgi:hypothetical protein